MKNFLAILTLLLSFSALGQDATEIVRKADERFKGKTSKATVTISIVRPKYTREMRTRMWSKGDDYSLVIIETPKKDAGTTFLKRDKEIWNWVPTIERTIKLPPSMMTQNWMGTDFTNDDLVKQSSIVVDYNHQLAGEETVAGYACHKIILTPKEEAAVVWGKVILWVEKDNFMQLKTEFYDEDDFLINVMKAYKPIEFGGKLLPSVMEMIPLEKPGQKTVMTYNALVFDEEITDDFFTVRNMKNAR